MKHAKFTALALLSALAAGCSRHVQITSGAEYLARYDAQAEAHRQIGTTGTTGNDIATDRSTTRPDLDPAIRKAASVEPILQFPARFGIARVEGLDLTGIPAAEAALWQRLAESHAGLGTFVPVEPLVALATAGSLGVSRNRHSLAATVDTIRVGAARQHLDAVLIYAVGQRGDKSNTVLALMDITLIGGAFLPTRQIEIEGLARAMLLDVRNGYPYGIASASVDLSEYSTSFGSDARTADLRREAVLKVTEKLVPEIDALLTGLSTRLQAQH